MTPRLRPAGPRDGAAVTRLFIRAVHGGTAPHYTRAEARAWAVPGSRMPGLVRRLGAGRAWIAGPGVRGVLVARDDGYLDLFFVAPEERGGPVARALYAAYAAWLDTRGIERATTHASRLLRPFLARRGWVVTERQNVLRQGKRLERFAMERR